MLVGRDEDRERFAFRVRDPGDAFRRHDSEEERAERVHLDAHGVAPRAA